MTANDFAFSPKFRLQRHLLYWVVYLCLWAGFWTMVGLTYPQNLFKMLIWCPAFMLYSYPLAYYAVPKWLLTGRYFTFSLVVIGWAIFGWYLNIYFRIGVYFPLFDRFGLPHSNLLAEPASFLCMTTTVGSMSVSTLTKRWIKKQQEWYQAEREKVAAQLQLLRAQLHPHFLFNTLNNIYSFALDLSPKTPQMILKLSSLLSYMLYECRTDEVLLEKEVEIMKNYIDLEKERYGDKIDISVNIEGDIQDKYITPLLMLPFIENAFKHGTSEQLERPWMSVDIAVKGNVLHSKVVNSKNEVVPFGEHGVGIANVKKRLQLLYPGKHELKLAEEGDFFVVMLMLQLPAPVISMQTGKEKARIKYS